MSATTAASRSQQAYPEGAVREGAIAIPSPSPWGTALVRLADYVELSKPRISTMVLVTVAVGYTLGCEGNWQLAVLLPALFGVALVAAGSSALNQYLEQITDAHMRRTADRPLPSGRMSSAEVLVFGLLCGAVGTVWLATAVNGLTAALTLSTLLMYVLLYTPLKRRTSLCTAVGAVPGALPPVIGWAAARDSLDAGAFALFAIVFLWQFPHFLAIAWLYRDQYDAAGLKMLPRKRTAGVIGLMAVIYATALIPVSLLPRSAVLAGDSYGIAAAVLGLVYLAGAARFAMRGTRASARGLLLVSLMYLPALLLVMTFDHLRLLM